jgi:hypothetical protein
LENKSKNWEKEIEVVGMASEPTKKLFKEIEHYLD